MTKAERSKELRYKKGIAEGFNLEGMISELYDICEACADIRYIMDGDEDALIDALDGDEEDAYEFRMMFSELDAECERLHTMLSEEYVTEHFDDFFCRVVDGAVRRLGFDAYEEDYYALSSFESRLAKEESGKRLMRLNKADILQAAEQCFGIATAFLNIRYKFDYLKATFDILKGENASYLQMVKDIESAYEKAAEDSFYDWSGAVKEFDKLVEAMPNRAWLE